MAVHRGELYPNYLLPIIGESLTSVDADEFDIVREELLLPFGYHTARAYWGDLEQWRDYCECVDPVVDPLNPTSDDITAYLALLKDADYSPNTIARRLTTFRAFYDLIDPAANPARQLEPVRRRKSGY